MSGEGVQHPRKRIPQHDTLNAASSLRIHWPEYLMEAGELALYMFSVCAFATLVRHPASPVPHFIVHGVFRTALMGLGIGATVVAIVMTPWGKRSGGHFNPAITFTFYRLGKVGFWDALFYATAQFLGAIGGVAIATYALRGAPGHEAVRYAVTAPGIYGNAIAFVAELTISFTLMITVLLVSNRETRARYTPYFAAPLLGMLGAAEVFLRVRGGAAPRCAKLYHTNDKRCIFHCGYRISEAQDS